jgi:tetratricopeptide (TPR) repeat protein
MTHEIDRYVALAEGFRADLYGADSAVWMDRLDQELDGLRDVLRLSAASPRREDVEQAMRIAGGLREYWWKRDRLQEGRAWLLRLLALPQASYWSAVRAQGLDDAAVLAFYQGDYVEAISLLKESIDIWRDLNAREEVVYSLLHLASIHRVGNGDVVAARAVNQEALATAEQMGFERGIGYALSALGRVAVEQEDWPIARSQLSESLRVLHRLGDAWALTIVLRHCALLDAVTDAPRRSLRLAAASAAAQENLGMATVPADAEPFETALARARMMLPAPEADAAWKEGRSMSVDDAVDFAMRRGVRAS